jgi:pimeloyl-ACP methyl ester carboxylesterase
MFVNIGGIEQWVQVDGAAPKKPVLLFLHGGPGGSSRIASEAWKPWEQYFTLVHWDQRGAGLTLDRNGKEGCGPLTIDGMIQDGLELAEFLRRDLRNDTIILVGHSWGSILGVGMIKRRPDLFVAYVGTGQAVHMRRNEEINYAKLVARAKAARNQAALAALAEIGPPPYQERDRIRILRHWSDELATGSGDSVQPRPHPLPANLSVKDVEIVMRGFQYSGSQLFGAISAVDLPSLGLDFEVPMFIFMGSEDQQTATELAEAYFLEIRAPHKEFVRFEGCHHFVVFNRPHDFLQEMIARVLPAIA